MGWTLGDQGFILWKTLSGRWPRWALLVCLEVLVGVLVATWTLSHYIAPITALILALVFEAMRKLHRWQWRDRPTGRVAVCGIAWVAVLSLIVGITQQYWAWRPYLRPPGSDGERLPDWSTERAHIQETLDQSGGRHLVMVRYHPDHNLHNEWVYNRADIDGAPVVWARELQPEQNAELMRYFRERKVWLLQADEDFPKPIPYLVDSQERRHASPDVRTSRPIL